MGVSSCSRSLSVEFGDDENAHRVVCTACAGLLSHEPYRAGWEGGLQCPVKQEGSFAVL